MAIHHGHPPYPIPGLPRRRGVPPRRGARHGAPGAAGRQRRRAAEPQEPQTAECAEDAKMQKGGVRFVMSHTGNPQYGIGWNNI